MKEVDLPLNDVLKKLIEAFCQINSVANPVGKGRSDFTIDILKAAEDVLKERSSKAMKALALQIKGSFNKLRKVIQDCSTYIEELDPQLKENGSLVEALIEFEKTWEKGKQFLTNEKLLKVFHSFSLEMEKLEETNDDIKEKIRSMDVEVFLMIPCLAVLRSLEENDTEVYSLCGTNKNLWHRGDFIKLKEVYENEKKKCNAYQLLETAILKGEVNNKVIKLLNDIKQMAVILQRSSPSDWNSFIEIILVN